MPIPTTEELARLAAAEPQGADVEFTTPPSLWDERLYAWLMAMKEHGLSFESLDEESHARAIKMIENSKSGQAPTATPPASKAAPKQVSKKRRKRDSDNGVGAKRARAPIHAPSDAAACPEYISCKWCLDHGVCCQRALKPNGKGLAAACNACRKGKRVCKMVEGLGAIWHQVQCMEDIEQDTKLQHANGSVACLNRVLPEIVGKESEAEFLALREDWEGIRNGNPLP